MTACDSDSMQDCEFCDKEGLLVFPTRYAVASADANMPEPSAPENDKATPVPLPVSTAVNKFICPDPNAASTSGTHKSAKAENTDCGPLMKYATRTLRQGFLYVYDENKANWEGYYVTPKSYLFKLNLKQPTPKLKDIEFACKRKGSSALASCVTIEDPDNAGKVWFGFSDVPWTEGVFKQNASAAARDKHMRCFDVAKWRGQSKHPHAVPIDAIDAVVSECSRLAHKAAKYFNQLSLGNVFDAWHEKNVEDFKTKASEKTSNHKAACLAVDDPVGIAQDLSGFMRSEWDAYLSKCTASDTFNKALVTSGIIDQARSALEHKAVSDYIDEYETALQDHRQVTGNQGPVLAAPGSGVFGGQFMHAGTEIKPISEARIAEVSEKAWDPYISKYDEVGRQRWKKNVAEEFDKFVKGVIDPIAIAHVGWMKSSIMSASFAGNFDDKDIQNGAAYTALVTQCIGDTQDKQPCNAHYTECLEGSLQDSDNVILRACLFNHQPLADAVLSATHSSPTMALLPWDKLVNAYGSAATALSGDTATVMGRFLGGINGVLAGVLEKAATSGAVYDGLTTLGMVHEKPLVRIELEDTWWRFRDYTSARTTRMAGGSPRPKDVRAQLTANGRRLKADHPNVRFKQKVHWIVFADEEAFRQMPDGLSSNAQAKYMANHVYNIDEASQIRLDDWQARVKDSGMVKGVGSLGVGVIGAAIDFAALDALIRAEATALKGAKARVITRVWSQRAQIAGSIGEAVGIALTKLSALELAGGISGSVRFLSLGIRLVSRTIGIAGALIMTGVDFWQAWHEFKDHNLGVAIGLTSSGLISAGFMVFMALEMFMLAGLAFVALLVITLAISYFSDNPIQDWLQNTCFWGEHDRDDQYQTLESEVTDFNKATGGHLKAEKQLEMMTQQLKQAAMG